MISGRNGSGKSSFAEALELVLTGTSCRREKSTLWAEIWQNLHQPSPCEIGVGFAREETALHVGMQWAVGGSLGEHKSWTQTGAGKRVEGSGGLGWSRPLGALSASAVV